MIVVLNPSPDIIFEKGSNVQNLGKHYLAAGSWAAPRHHLLGIHQAEARFSVAGSLLGHVGGSQNHHDPHHHHHLGNHHHLTITVSCNLSITNLQTISHLQMEMPFDLSLQYVQTKHHLIYNRVYSLKLTSMVTRS